MPIIKSAKKRVKVAKKAAIRNSKTKRALRSSIKAFVANLGSDDARAAQSALDKAVKKGVIHKNKAARKQRQIATKAKAAGTKVEKSTAKKTTAKAAPKKVTKATTKPAAKTTKKAVKKS